MSASFGFFNHNIDLSGAGIAPACVPYACDALQTVIAGLPETVDHWPCDGEFGQADITENLTNPGNTLYIDNTGGGALPARDIVGDIWLDKDDARSSINACSGDDGYHWEHLSGSTGAVWLENAQTLSTWWSAATVGAGMAVGMLVRNPLPSGTQIDNTQHVVNMRIQDINGSGENIRWAVGPDNCTIQNISDGKPTFAHGLDFDGPRYILCTVYNNGVSYRWSMYDVETETRIGTMSSALLTNEPVDEDRELVIELFDNYQRIDFKELAIFKLDSFESDITSLMASLKLGFERNFNNYIIPEDCGVQPCNSFVSALEQQVTESSSLFLWSPLSDTYAEYTANTNTFLNKVNPNDRFPGQRVFTQGGDTTFSDEHGDTAIVPGACDGYLPLLFDHTDGNVTVYMGAGSEGMVEYIADVDASGSFAFGIVTQAADRISSVRSQNIFQFNLYTGSGDQYVTSDTNGYINMTFNRVNEANGETYTYQTDNPVIPDDGDPHFIVFTMDYKRGRDFIPGYPGLEHKIYVDGVLVDTAVMPQYFYSAASLFTSFARGTALDNGVYVQHALMWTDKGADVDAINAAWVAQE